MSDMVCCPLSSGDEGGPSCYTMAMRRARVAHVCGECNGPIPAGAQYEYVSGIWDGRAETFKSCLSCVEIRNHFACGQGFVYEQLWSDLEENFFPDMKAGGPCMTGLSPEAKARLFERRIKWLEDQT